jgi:hypothetical protein
MKQHLGKGLEIGAVPIATVGMDMEMDMQHGLRHVQ